MMVTSLNCGAVTGLILPKITYLLEKEYKIKVKMLQTKFSRIEWLVFTSMCVNL